MVDVAERRLTNKQRVFVEEYLQTWNATEAARRAGYKGNNDTLRSVGSENLAKPYIKARIQERLREKALSADEVLSRLAEQATVNIAEFISECTLPDEDGNLYTRYMLNWDAVRARGHLIKSITNTQHGPRLELHDGQTALIHIGKHHKLFADRQIIDLEESLKTYVGISPDDWDDDDQP